MTRISRRHALQAAAAGLVATTAIARTFRPAGARPVLAGTVYTANEIGNSISAIILATRRVETFPVPISPHNVQISPDGRRLLAVGNPAQSAGHGHDDAGMLLVFDVDRPATSPIASIAVGRHPAHVVPDRTGRLALVSLSDENAVAAVDLAAGRLLHKMPTGAYPHGLRLRPDSDELWVANVGENSLSILDLRSRRETAQVAVGAAPVQVGFLPSGRHLFASLRDENAVAVVDVEARKLLRKIRVGRGPIQVFAAADGRSVYVANQGSEADPDRCLCIVDAQRAEVVARIPVGRGAHGVVASPDGHVFVSNIVDGTVSIVDPAGRTVLDTIRVGAGPNGITYRSATENS
ncbi:MAG: hypothetical protein K0S81_1858 [Rhodospirillales bacterium]|jgi:YVTN family beta-propeller protein|nr:hypothetical protein [Rhodospirillales bacterium]